MPGKRFGIIIGSFMMLVLLTGPAIANSSHSFSHVLPKVDAQTEHGALGIVIPLYVQPGSAWMSVIYEKQSYPNVPFIVVINPDSGPGASPNPSYLSAVQEMQAAQITVLGYVDTAYAADTIQSVEANVNLYNSWYGVNGIMFDDMAHTLSTQSYYATLNTYVHSIGLSVTMGNPGSTVPSSEAGVLNILDIYEYPGLPGLATLAYSGDPTSDFSLIAYGVSSLSDSFLQQALGYVSYVYLTDASGSNPYDVLPSYFTTEVAELSAIDSSSASSGNPASPISSLTVNSVNSVGNLITGYYTELYSSSGTVVSTSFTPSTYSIFNGAGYQIAAYSYGGCTFSYWAGSGSISGSTADPSPIITISSPTTITAVYTGSSCGGQTTNNIGTVTVESAFQNGYGADAFGGMYAVIESSSGVIVAQGFTPLAYSGMQGDQYIVMLDNYGTCTFTHWADGSTANPRTFSAIGGMTSLAAVYSCSQTSTIQVKTVNSLGNSVPGYQIVLLHNGIQVDSCFSTCSFTVNVGEIYQVIADGYGPEAFSYWANDGSTGAETIEVPPGGSAISLTAIYSP